ILKDARMREQAGAIRAELGHLHGDLQRLGERVANLDRHFGQAAKDLSDIRISAERAGRRAERLDRFDFSEPDPEPAPGISPAPVQPSAVET
ncbi:MAG: DNA recombination protein RmuC, partial [Pseudomonadota bacterium]